MIDKIKVYETTYETIEETLEWGLGEKDYTYFVDGVIAMTENLLSKFPTIILSTNNETAAPCHTIATSGYVSVAEDDIIH